MSYPVSVELLVLLPLHAAPAKPDCRVGELEVEIVTGPVVSLRTPLWSSEG